MRISVYAIQSLKPETPEQEAEFCEILNLPSLKHGVAEFIGDKIDSVTKTYLRTKKLTAAQFYDLKAACWRSGVIILEHPKPKVFAECVL